MRKWVAFNVQRFIALGNVVKISGATVTLAGQSGVTDATGFVGLTVPQSAALRPYTVTAPGYAPGAGSLAGEAPVATEAQSETVTVNLTPSP